MIASISSAKLRHLHDYWQARRVAGGGLPRRRDIEVQDLKPCLGHLLLLDIATPIERSRYRLFGTALVQFFGEDLTGKEIIDVNAVSVEKLIDEYRSVADSGEPRRYVNRPMLGTSVFEYEKVILPLGDGGRAVVKIIAGIDRA